MNKRLRAYLLTLIVTGAVACVIFSPVLWLMTGDSIKEWWNRRAFDSAEWKSVQNQSSDMRIRMVDDLLRKTNFQGMTRDQVTALIGEPDQTEYFSNWDMVYWLGPERCGMMGIDSEWLVLRLDDQKRVSEYQLETD